MGRKSMREQRRSEIILAFGGVLADHGFAGATTTAIAEAAGLSPGLLHHHFKSKDEMLSELLSMLMSRFKSRLEGPNRKSLDVATYMDQALKLDATSDSMAAKCWVGVLAEAIRNPTLFNRVKRLLDDEIVRIKSISGNTLETNEASAVLAYIFGSLVFGAFAPRKTAGFASEGGHALLKGLTED